ncbi:ABC transporter G family member 49-like, partial [Cornus florida]|uniref:ABC transporter G family member 49-like n=1 Tax=Cornus florida TaxID=4283 RepID=UPI00289D68FB
MIIGPAKVLLVDEISTGLDSSTTFQIVSCLQQWTRISGSTILVSLLQLAPETFDLFDDIILMAEGKIVYHGPRNNVLEFVEHCGFKCPPRKGITEFLQEVCFLFNSFNNMSKLVTFHPKDSIYMQVVSKKDQPQYWHYKDQPYNYVLIAEFGNKFRKFHVGQKLDEELSRPFSKYEFNKNALSFNIYSLGKWEVFKACIGREWLLMKCNSFVHIFKSAQ